MADPPPDPLRRRCFTVHASRYGGEHVIGTLDVTTALWWLKNKNENEFRDAAQRDEQDDVPEEFRLVEWWDIDDIDHINGPEFCNGLSLTITEGTMSTWEEGTEICTIGITEESSAKVVSRIDELAALCDTHPDGGPAVVVFGQSFEKGCWTFELEAYDDFEPDLLCFGLSRWNDLWLLTTLVYDGEEFTCDDIDTMGKSMECWIDDDSRINTWAYLSQWSPKIHAEFPTRHRVCLRAVLLAALRGRKRDGAAAVSQATLSATPLELWVVIFQYLGSLDYVM